MGRSVKIRISPMNAEPPAPAAGGLNPAMAATLRDLVRHLARRVVVTTEGGPSDLTAIQGGFLKFRKSTMHWRLSSIPGVAHYLRFAQN